jgi:hypothetical protein
MIPPADFLYTLCVLFSCHCVDNVLWIPNPYIDQMMPSEVRYCDTHNEIRYCFVPLPGEA